METLAKLFGSVARVKIMKLFLLNPEQAFDNIEISSRTKIIATTSRKELSLLSKIKFIKKKSFFKEVGDKSKTGKKRKDGWILNKDFLFLAPLQNLLIESGSLKSKEVADRLKNVGNLKLLIVAGVFIQDLNSRADILIVGDNLNEVSLERSMRILESEVGRELRYVVFETSDFKYRLGIYDKLLRDILDYSHKKIINKIGI
ncbi:MAG: hypothetical protein U9P50_01320 [Patescibacteria group bacterium]|nr:hypothetical protein [Patescibacteria group bacterium]